MRSEDQIELTPAESLGSAEQPAAIRSRVDAIDLARGIAIALMILSHGVVALVGLDQIPTPGLVPIHLITKFSSTLFLLVFGISLAVAFVPAVGTEAWPRKRRQLLLRGLVVFFAYKALTVVEMFNTYSREDVLDTLLYRAFPVYAEILGFYAVALLWIPLVLPLWKRVHTAVQLLVPLGLIIAAQYLRLHFDFWGSESLAAIIVEHEKHYTWGQLARAPYVFAGLVIGKWISGYVLDQRLKLRVVAGLGVASLAVASAFVFVALPDWSETLRSIAMNEGKHPPETKFTLFSLAGALSILTLALLGGRTLALILRPITIIGRNSLRSFVFHIAVIFIVYRYLLNLWRAVSYSEALALTALLIILTVAWVKISDWAQSGSHKSSPNSVS